MPEENQSAPVPSESKSNILDKNVPNPLTKNPNVHTHKVFASIGLILFGTLVILGILAIVYRGQLGDFLKQVPEGPNIENPIKPGKIATDSSKTESSKKDGTEGWKTHKGSKYSIKYPSDWQVLENINHISTDSPNYDHFYLVMQEMEPGVNVFITSKTTAQAWSDKQGSGPDTPKFTEYIVDGIKGTWVDKGSGFQPFVIVDKDQNSYIISLSTPLGYENQEYEEIFTKMVRSFKFL